MNEKEFYIYENKPNYVKLGLTPNLWTTPYIWVSLDRNFIFGIGILCFELIIYHWGEK